MAESQREKALEGCLAAAALFVTGGWCAVSLFAAADVLSAVKWGISGTVLLLVAAMMKMSLMPVLQADRVIREVKRIELLLAKRG